MSTKSLGTIPHFTDDQLEERVDMLRIAVKTWAERNSIWEDARFDKVIKHFDMATGAPTVATLRAGGLLAESAIYPGMGAIHDTHTVQRLTDECEGIFKRHGFYGEPFDECRVNIIPLEQHQPSVFQRFKEYKRWQWICSLVQGDFDVLNTELYEYLGNNPSQLKRLGWRDFEKLIAELLQAQGFAAELGPGSGDGGVDIRFVQRDPIGDILTLVQVKKFTRLSVGLQAVQALHGAKTAYDADKSMFVTTSDYQPCARQFAGRENVQMDLCVSDDVRQWCEDATAGIIENKQRLTTATEVVRALDEARSDPGRLVHAKCGYGMRFNIFGLVLKESAGSALVVDIPHRIIEHDGYGQAGTEVPDLTDEGKVLQAMKSVRRLRKRANDQRYRFADLNEEVEFYETWNREPAEFHGD